MSRDVARYREIFDSLKNDILNGGYSESRPFPSSTALTRRYKTTRATIRRALDLLRNEGLVVTRRGAGTFVTREGLSRKIGLIVPGVDYCEIYPPIVSEILQVAQEGGFKLLIGDVHYSTSSGWTQRVRTVAEGLVRDGVSGVLFQPVEYSPGSTSCNRDILSIFAEAGIPVVLIGYDAFPPPSRSDCDVVGINNLDAGRRLAEHVSGQGARRVAFFLNAGDMSLSGDARVKGVSTVLGKGAFDERRDVLRADPDDVRSVGRFVRRHRPDAFICGNDTVAAALRATLGKLGLRVPNDILLAGFDDVNIARLTRLTSVQQPCAKIARIAFRRLLDRISEPHLEPVEILLTAPLTVRESTQRMEKGRRK